MFSATRTVRYLVQRRLHSSSRIPPSVIAKNEFSIARLLGYTIVGSVATGTVYDGAVNGFENIQGAHRFLRSLGIGLSISLDYAWSLKGLTESDGVYETVLQEVHRRSAQKLLDGCLANGGLYIKIGQGVAAINHIIPKEYVETLRQLEDRCLIRQPDEVRSLFVEDFGAPPEEVFASFQYEPIAAASLAQVFRAVTHSGEQVAVKVQYADLRKRFDGDLRTIMFLQKLVALIHKNYNFGWIIDDLQGTLREELDFVHEGKNAERCAKDLEKCDFVYVPKVLWGLTNERILTCEYIDGCKISDRRSIDAQHLNVSEIDRQLFTAFGRQIFSTGFVHADPHPGNVFVRKNPSNPKRLQLVLLDHGLYEQLTPDVRENLCRFWEAIVLRDHPGMEKFAKLLNVSDYRTFAEILLQRPLQLKGPAKTRLTEQDLAYMTKQAKEHFDRIMTTLRCMPRNLILVIRNLNTIRSIARDHGDPIDRPTILARCALAALCPSRLNVRNFVWVTFRRLRFEFLLW
ncbi:AGAP006050-PA-like protein [Anopheles sinensis]|uniref:ABC1 domain-containing protein n=1 Tax=Anopheles sinensis TaxID=74873 RepID=A0A084W445_ANOSI|nr:AGAP006050-PA-like protein [Anopheles sinensis]